MISKQNNPNNKNLKKLQKMNRLNHLIQNSNLLWLSFVQKIQSE